MMMKKILILVFAIFTMSIAGVDAQSQKKMKGKLVKAPGSKTIRNELPDKNFFRAVGNGVSTRESSAKIKAEMTAKRAISEQIKQNMQTVTEQYTSELDAGEQAEFQQSMQNMTVVAAKNILSGVVPGGYELYYKKKEGKYNAYVMMEVSKEVVKKAMANQLSKDNKLKLEFDKQKFQNVFDSEMAKIE